MPGPTHPSLYGFQAALTRWAIRWAIARGRAAIFADCGLGKTRMQVEWARQMPGPRLIGRRLAGYVALQRDRRFVGVELKREYFEQARRNLASARAQEALAL